MVHGINDKSCNSVSLHTKFPDTMNKSDCFVKLFLIVQFFVFMGCNNENQFSNLGKAFESTLTRSRLTTIELSEYRNGQLRVVGSCGLEGEVLLILTVSPKDDRIIGSPKCKSGKYILSTSTVGRPPCGIVVEYGGDKSTTAKVKGAEIYCQ